YSFYVDKEDFSDAKTVMEGMTLEYPEEEKFYEKTATLYGKLNDYQNAAFYFRKAFALSPSPEKAKYLFVLYFKLDRPADAMAYLDYSINNSGRGFTLQHIKVLAGEIMDLKKKYSENPADVTIPGQIARKYFEMGNKDAATKYLEIVLHADSKNKEALSLLAKIKS
ncbi:MAG TPA: tetratricopeptide repeat protein, partial [Puia sp.]|nr:tetratricopeptide repeat protein [Puia sp.]